MADAHARLCLLGSQLAECCAWEVVAPQHVADRHLSDRPVLTGLCIMRAVTSKRSFEGEPFGLLWSEAGCRGRMCACRHWPLHHQNRPDRCPEEAADHGGGRSGAHGSAVVRPHHQRWRRGRAALSQRPRPGHLWPRQSQGVLQGGVLCIRLVQSRKSWEVCWEHTARAPACVIQ